MLQPVKNVQLSFRLGPIFCVLFVRNLSIKFREFIIHNFSRYTIR